MRRPAPCFTISAYPDTKRDFDVRIIYAIHTFRPVPTMLLCGALAPGRTGTSYTLDIIVLSHAVR